MKVGDIVKYGCSRYEDGSEVTGLVLGVGEPVPGTLKVLNKFGKIDWFVTSYCEVVSEAR